MEVCYGYKETFNNYFDNINSSTCVVFKDNSSGNVYTCNNVNSGTLVAANGMTETQK